jgi:hypothetical protein
MALSGTGAVLGESMATAAGTTDATGQGAWKAIATSLCSQLPPLAAFDPTGGTPLVSAAGVISGTGKLVMQPGSAMGPGLAAAAGSKDQAAIDRWTAIGLALTKWMGLQGSYQAGLVGFVAPPPPAPGPVTGTGTLTFVAPIGDLLAPAAGILPTDTVGTTVWKAIGLALEKHLKTNLQIPPMGLTNPGPGGPVIGAAAVK